MSRSSKGFADFFPTAPSVLEQKRSRTAQHRQRQKSPLTDSYNHRQPSSIRADVGSGYGDSGTIPHARTTDREDVRSEPTPISQDDSDLAQGDLLNGVGSASSSSTASSVFSTAHHAPGLARGQPAHNLTPLTNSDSSPPRGLKSPIHTKYESHAEISNKSLRPLPQVHSMTQTTSISNPSDMCGSWRTNARPGKGEAKGTRVVYDPDLDKTLSSKERKGRKVQYETFGEEVCDGRISLLPLSKMLECQQRWTWANTYVIGG